MIPGKLLIENTLKRCCEDDSIVRMNAISEVLWLRSWGATSVPVQQAHVTVTHFGGYMLVALFRLQWHARELVHSLRAWWAKHAPSSGSKTTKSH
jgi:hypothetical protein